MTGQKRFRFWMLIAGVFIAPLMFFSSQFSPWSSGSGSRAATILQDISYPLAWAWHATYSSIDASWNRYVDLSGKSKENERLRQEVTQLRARQLDYDERLNELNRLRLLAGFTQSIKQTYQEAFVPAEVFMTQRALPFKTIRISRGQIDGVKIGMPVVASDGVVGRVIRVGLKFSDVQLLVDYDSNIDVLVQRNRIRGVLGGYANENCRLHLQRSAEVKIGDTLVTSGIVGSFPKGIPVGKVTRISFETDNVSQVITVDPWVDHRRLEEVIVLSREDPELGRIAEAGGPDWIEKAMNANPGG
jgi:rod shape-determining protein MreC